MPEPKNSKEPPGNDGSWFLEIVAPSDGAASADAAVATAVTETTLEQDALSTWAPEEPVEPKRHTVLIAIAIAAVAIIAIGAGLWLRGTSARQADDAAVSYQRALHEMQAVLPQTQQILGNVTDPFTDPATLPSLEPLLSDLDDTADRVILLATEPLSDPPPLAPSAPLEALQPTRVSMVALGDEALLISGRISDGLAYRVLIDDFMVLPDLPVRAASSQIDEVAAGLDTSLEESTRILGLLPDDPAFAEHRAIAAEALDEYRRWQPPYLEALRSGDEDLTFALIGDIESVVIRVDVSLEPSLARLRSEVDAELLILNDGIGQTVAAIP